jgi:hypothetical protein
VPISVHAQNTGIGGVVKDTSGAVMPGVTVEASSPALIEKIRSVVTDAQGPYSIVDLRPGTYNVTFTLSGFPASSERGSLVGAAPSHTRNLRDRFSLDGSRAEPVLQHEPPVSRVV